MQNIMENLRSQVIHTTASSMGDIVETLFKLRKWCNVPEKLRIKECVETYLSEKKEGFWAGLFLQFDGNLTGADIEKLARDVIRSLDRTITLRDRTRAEILEIFFSPERFRSFMEGDPLTGYDSRRRSKEQKVRMAGQFSKAIKEKNNNGGSSLSRMEKKPSLNKRGTPRIGPKIRLFGANLSRDQVKKNMAIWSQREDELYNG